MRLSRKTRKHLKHAPMAIVLASLMIFSLYFSNLYIKESNKVLALQERINELSNTLSQTASSIQASTSQTIANAIQAIPKPPVVVPQKTQDELVRLAFNKVSKSVASINILQSTTTTSLSSTGAKTSEWQVEKVGKGSGIVIRSDGYIATNNHVVSSDSENYYVTLADGFETTAKVVYRNREMDVAIIKINGRKFTPATLGNSDNIEVGDTVEAIGNALGEYSNSVSVGIVSGLHRVIEASNGSQKILINDAIQTDAAINPGNSGGPLVDINGNVIGMTVATVIGSSNISFAIPINVIKSLIDEATN